METYPIAGRTHLPRNELQNGSTPILTVPCSTSKRRKIFLLMVELLQTVLRSTIAQMFTPGADADAIERMFSRKLTILQRGMMKKEGERHAC